MSVTGTGTKEDPYVIDTYDEFMAKLNSKNSSNDHYKQITYITFPENTVWDMNEIYPEGVYQTDAGYKTINGFTFYDFFNIKGNGLIIKNLYCKGTYWLNYVAFIGNSTSDYPFDMYDVHFENMHLNGGLINFNAGTSTDRSYSNTARFYGCTFSGISNMGVTNPGGIFRNYNSISSYSGHTYINFYISPNTKKGCGFEIENPQGALFYGDGGSIASSHRSFYIEYAHIIYNGGMIMQGGSSNNNYYNAYFLGCYIEGTEKNRNHPGSFGGNISVFDLYTPSRDIVSSNDGINLWNMDKSPLNDKYNFKSVTTQQLTDVEFLRSLGFPAG